MTVKLKHLYHRNVGVTRIFDNPNPERHPLSAQ